MKLISHRVNSISKLLNTETKYGVEVDIRSNKNDLIIHHDPFSDGENFEEWLKVYNHDTLILNVKEEGLESSLLDLMGKYGIKDFFFLDQSFPFLVKWARNGESRCAVRFSEYESIDTAITLSNQVDWIWIDCFTNFPLTNSIYLSLKDLGFKLCLVSPELQGRDPVHEIPLLYEALKINNFNIDAVCSKRIDIWEEELCKI